MRSRGRASPIRIRLRWGRPLFSLYRGTNLLMELRIWPINIEVWDTNACPRKDDK